MIGVFDSGLGALSVLAAIAQALPRADLVRLARVCGRSPVGHRLSIARP